MTDKTLQRYRESIDNIDAAVIYMLAERFKITQAKKLAQLAELVD